MASSKILITKIIVEGTTASEINAERDIDFPTSLTGKDCFVLGYCCKATNNLWYSNDPSIEVITTSNIGIRIVSKSALFVNQPIRVYLGF